MLKEFREFILKGNAIDLAVGVLIGAAFGDVVKAFTTGIINPLINAAGGKPDVSLKLWIFDLGVVVNAVLSLIIVGAILFFVFIKPMNRLKTMMEKKADAPGEPEIPADVKLLAEIRDLLKNKA
ncbi:large conductance mechanosensitive channel protein MscL [Luteolibacter ambystomatis]|uniref:Large-conductance mechanosensitive channel n=1 Tax=Luteolibacter ambystomatis TaxID=2824561 RepID=A0A975G994_9BACT|nr:large conductance mechanosensitive channel protein MscL [Luteolibacter ambystomatis]QUE50665.1 large conductance mechanosensitive channel protein MscL [Luteolibacter ambystomatis]